MGARRACGSGFVERGDVSSLTCDLCSGTLEMGVGGLATCNDCGMKYTRDRMQEKLQEMKGAGAGSSPVASGPSIENLRELAAHALESNNLDEAEAYASRIIEADPSDYQAWSIKGQAAGWQSSLKNMRILEAANCFAKAVELAPETFRDHVEEHVSGQISSIASAIIKTRASIYIEYPEPEQAEPFERDLRQIIEAVKSLLGRSGTRVKGIWEDIATQINNAVVKAWTDVIQPDFKNDPHPSDYDLQRFLNRLSAAEDLTKLSIGLSDDDDVDDVVRYRNLILYAENRRDARSYEWTVNGYVGSRSLTAEAKAVNNRLIGVWRAKIKELEAGEAKRKQEAEKRESQARYDAYWATRQDERKGYERKESQLSKKLEELQAKAGHYEGRDELPVLAQELSTLRSAYEATSRLKRAERKDLQGQIDAVESRRAQITQAQQAARAAVVDELAQTEARLKAVQAELTKPK